MQLYITSRILWLIFNKSLVTGTFPNLWKVSIVTPIFKSGDKTLVSNYRPISKQNIMPKIFENIIASKLSALFKNIIINEQHGFMCGRSTSTNLLLYHDFINSAMEEGSLVNAIYILISVKHLIPLIMLCCYISAFGIDGSMLKWISSFITDRSQVVKFNKCFSRIINPISGVPQGSHLGLLLFNLFINEVLILMKHLCIVDFCYMQMI